MLINCLKSLLILGQFLGGTQIPQRVFIDRCKYFMQYTDPIQDGGMEGMRK